MGEFFRTGTDSDVDFRYDSDESTSGGVGVPISLSLPLSGVSSRRAPKAFLENMLPDDPNARQRMAARLHISSTDTFDLLDGADTVGGLVFTRRDKLPDMPLEVRPLDDEELARQIGYVRANGYNWFARDIDDEFNERAVPRCRFSIAGGQPKFTVARRGGVWLWPNLDIPSTHIIKPEVLDCPNSDTVENATMTLGEMCGLPVAEHGLLEVAGTRAFITRRFDRVINSGIVRRVHCEDLAQSMGMMPGLKYDIDAISCVRFLRGYDETNKMAYEWVRRLAFNISSGDCDSHGKNYSIIFTPSGFRFSPMYDLTSTRTWPQLDQELSMSINGVQYADWLTPSDWAAFARAAGLDEERVVRIARVIAHAVLMYADQAVRDVPAPQRDAMLRGIIKSNANIEPVDEPLEDIGADSSVFSGYQREDDDVWVRPYVREDHHISGYWRRRDLTHDVV
ncbi:phosphatidylinositol kinase [Bifidobacterium sp. UTCIF-37]|nr:phosphatidylinositol kinase [Bifidobacterium sp. UTCIF-37]TPF87791.1 phosphatidylinositol kinase [Bifidobacterium sp. UTCIF-38]